MSPFLVFLNAARNLAGMGMKREQVLDFAKREFGELTELMKSQIDNIYRPKKSVSPKDPDFDDTVVKMKFDDEGKPFNPRDPLKNLSKKDKKADGGRIGLRIGSGEGKDVSGREYSAPSAAARSVSTSPSRDDSPSSNFRDTTTKKQLLDTMVKGGKNLAINKAIEKSKFGKFFGPKGAAFLGLLNAIRGGAKKSLPGNLSMLDEEGIGSLPKNQFAELTPKQQKFIDKKKFGLQENLLDAKDVFETITNPDKGIFDKGTFGFGGQEPTTTQEFNDYLKSIGVVQQVKDGGRIGFSDGLSFPMKKDGFSISPDFDKMTEEQKMLMEGMKIQEKKRQEKIKKILDKIKESMPEDEKFLRPVPMPDRALPKTGIQSLAGGGRVGFKKGLLASMMEGLSPDGGIFQSIFANRKHPILSTFNATELLSIGEALGPLLGFNEGGRVGLKDGMDRRKFLKIMGGLASLPVLGKFFKGAKVASTAVPAVKEAVTKAPSYFFRLVDKIRRFGKVIDDSVADPRVERTYKYKDYELKEGAYGDPSETIITKKTDMGPNGYKEESMRFKKGGQTEDGFEPDEYEELTARPDMEGKLKDIEEGIDDASEFIEEASKSAPPIKKAAGGLAYMLGE